MFEINVLNAFENYVDSLFDRPLIPKT